MIGVFVLALTVAWRTATAQVPPLPLNETQRVALTNIYAALRCSAEECLPIRESEPCVGPEIICRQGDVQELRLNSVSLTGYLSTEFMLLTGLTSLSLSVNVISGTIPTQLWEMFGNRLSGTLPSQLALLTRLTTLNLGDNSFSGTIPVEFDQLIFLRELSLAFNQLVGRVPQLPNLDICSIQAVADLNCLDCTNVPARCVGNGRCNPRVCSTPAPPTPVIATRVQPTTDRDGTSIVVQRENSQVVGGVVGAILASLCCLVSVIATALLIRLNLKQQANQQ